MPTKINISSVEDIKHSLGVRIPAECGWSTELDVEPDSGDDDCAIDAVVDHPKHGRIGITCLFLDDASDADSFTHAIREIDRVFRRETYDGSRIKHYAIAAYIDIGISQQLSKFMRGMVSAENIGLICFNVPKVCICFDDAYHAKQFPEMELMPLFENDTDAFEVPDESDSTIHTYLTPLGSNAVIAGLCKMSPLVISALTLSTSTPFTL